jgi:hypothetical protein
MKIKNHNSNNKKRKIRKIKMFNINNYIYPTFKNSIMKMNQHPRKHKILEEVK